MARERSVRHFSRTYAVLIVPEPSTWASLVVGFAGLGLVTRRHRRHALLCRGPGLIV